MRVDAGAPPQTNDDVPLIARVFFAFLRLGLTSFGGPIAHLGYFNVEFVERRKWLDEDSFANVVALCQFLPGPASSQVAMMIGFMRAGAPGAAAAWLAFTLPSAIVMVAVAFGIARVPSARTSEWLHGFLIAAVAVVAVAVANMYRSLCPDVRRKGVALVVAAIVLCVPASSFVQLALVTLGAVYGRLFIHRAQRTTPVRALPIGGSPAIATLCALLFLALLIGLPLIGRFGDDGPLAVFAAFYESGALVFGGGHVVLPMLAARIVLPGWISPDAFLAGYGVAQAVPGPLFTFAAYLGAAMHGPVTGIGGACLALGAIYLPSFLLILAILPFWNRLRRNETVVAAISGVNAVVVGLLLAALYQPVWVNAIHAPVDVALVLIAFALLDVLRWQTWLVVISSALASFALGGLRHV